MATIESNFESICINPNDDLVLYEKEIIRSRIEKFLYAICSLDTDDLPTPLSRIEELYNCLVTGGDIPTFTPLSRAEKFVMAMLGAYDVELLPTPISRSETLMKKIATGDNNLDDVDNLQSKYEFLLAYIIKAGGFNGGSPDDPIYYVNYPINSSDTTLYNTVEYRVKNAVLRGQTLVNLGGTYNKTDAPTWYSVFATQQEVKQGNVYYAIINNTGDGLMRLRYKASDSVIKAVNPMSCEKFIFTATESDYLRIKNSDTISNCNGTFLLLNYQEGMENWDIPYFDGIQSVKMPVLTTFGKNLFDGKYVVSTYSSGKAISVENEVVSYPHTTSSNKRGICNIVKVIPNTEYSISIHNKPENTVILGTGYANIEDIKTQSLSVIHVGSVSNSNHTTLSLTTPSNCNYMVIGCYTNYTYEQSGGTVTFKKPPAIQLEIGSTATSYEPYKSTIVSCNEEVELRGIGDIKDELNLVTGEYTKAIYEYTFTGNEIWEISGGASGGYTYFQCKMNQLPINYKYKTDSNVPISCDRLPMVTYLDFDNGLKSVGINLTYFFRLNFSNCNSNNGATIEDLKAYLKANPTTVQYPISESIKTVDLSTVDQDGKETELTTFDDITHVTVSSEGLIPTGDIDIARPIQFVDYSLDNGCTTLYNTIEHPVKNTVLRGQTLVNKSSLTGVTTLTPGSVIFIENVGMKTNTTYTIMFNCSNTPSTNFVEVRTMMDNTQITQVQQNVSAGYNKFTIKTNASKETNRFRFKNDTSATTDFIFSELLILEGDYTNENIPYFEGMASVKMPVLTTVGKNLVGKLMYGNVTTGGNIADNMNQKRVRTDYVNIQNEEKITIKSHSEEVDRNICFLYDENKKFIRQTSWNAGITNSNGLTISIPSNTKYVICEFSHNLPSDKDLVLSNIKVQIEKGDTATFYEPFKTNILTVNEKVELRKVGDFQDELNLLTGELTQKTNEIVLDGSESWTNGVVAVGDFNRFGFISNNLQPLNQTYGICDKVPYKATNDEDEHIYISNSGIVFLFLSNTKASTVSELRTYLSSNVITLQYPITEVVKTVDLSTLDQDGKETELSTFDDITHVTLSSEGLVPTGEITVATKNATDVIDAGVMSLRMDDILNSQGTLEGSANAQSDDIDVTMLGTTDIYEQLL